MSRSIPSFSSARRCPVAWLVLALLAWSGVGPAAATTYVVFRYDDLAADKPGIRNYDKLRRDVWEAELAQDRLFSKYGVPYVAAVVPKIATTIQTNVVSLPEDPEKVEFIKQAVAAGRMQVAQHGFTHWNYSPPTVRRGEFRRADGQQQNQDIADGRKILTETLGLKQITTFVPPFNGWNDHTAAALVRNGFEILSADRQWQAPPDAPLTHIPFTAQLWELDGMLGHGGLAKDSVVVVLYHPPQLVLTKGSERRYYGLDKLASLLAKLTAMPEVKVVTFDQLRAAGLDLATSRYNAAIHTGWLQSIWSGILPARMMPGFARHFLFQTEGEYRHICLVWGAITLAAGAGLLLAGWLLFGLSVRMLPPLGVSILSAGALLALFSAGWLIAEIMHRGFHPTAIRFFPPWLLIGWLAAALIRAAQRSKPAPTSPSGV